MKYFFYTLIVLILIGVGYSLHPVFNPPSQVIDSTFVADTVEIEPEIKNPDISLVKAKVDSMLRDTLDKIINRLPTYYDTTEYIDTVEQYVYYAKTKEPHTLGYWRNDNFVKQGELKAWYLYPPDNEFIFDWNPNPPKIQTVTNTKYITVEQPCKQGLFDNKYVTYGLGVLSAVAFYETARRFELVR